MRYIFLILAFLTLACHDTSNPVISEVIKSIPDSTNRFYAKQFHTDYKRTREVERTLSLTDISNGTKGIELRYWNLSSFYNPQSVYLLKKVQSDEWTLRVIKYFHEKPDSITSEINMTFRNDIIATLNLQKYWNLNSQSEMRDGDTFGCTDGNTILLELSDPSRYKYIMYRCPQFHTDKDSSFYLVNKLDLGLRSLAKEQ